MLAGEAFVRQLPAEQYSVCSPALEKTEHIAGHGTNDCSYLPTTANFFIQSIVRMFAIRASINATHLAASAAGHAWHLIGWLLQVGEREPWC
jgi:hypothetical protein